MKQTDFTARFVHALLRKKAIVLIVAFLVAVVGFYCYYMIPKQENPNTSVAAATVVTVYPGASPAEVERDVTSVVEAQIDKLEHVDYYTSTSMDSASIVVILYDMDVTTDDIQSDLYMAVDAAAPSLPKLAQESIVNTNLVDDNQFILSLSGAQYTHAELVDYAKVVQGIMQDTKGVDTVVVEGEKQYRVVIELSQEKLESYGISITNITQLLQAQNLSIPSGSIAYDDTTINVVTPAVFESLQDIENTVISGSSTSLSFVTLADVANIYMEEVGDYAYFQDSESAVLISGTIQKGENAILVGKDLRASIDFAKRQLPPDLTFHEVIYAPQDIANSIDSFISNLLQSIALIILVVMIGVRVKNAIVISVALPLSILSTFIAMRMMSIEFHFISIASLIISLGILVDNALVMSEAIQMNLNRGMDKETAITEAVRANAMPVLTSTLTTIVTFSIVYFVPGVVGAVAGTIPTVVIASLVASYIVAMVIIPVLSDLFFAPEQATRIAKVSRTKMAFRSALRFGLSHRKTVVFGAFASLGISALLFLQLGLQFFPSADKAVLYVNFKGEAMSLDASLRAVQPINETLDGSDLVDHYTCAVGGGLPSFFLTVPTMTSAPNMAQYMLQLNTAELEKYETLADAQRALQASLDGVVTGGIATVKSLEYSMPTEAAVTLCVAGDDMDAITTASAMLTDALANIEGTSNVRDTKATSVYQYQVDLDSDLLSSFGLLKYDVLMQINTALMGTTVGTYYGAQNSLDIVVRSDVESLTALQDLQIVGSVAPTAVALSQVADISLAPSTPVITHYNGENYVYVLSDVLAGYSSMSIERALADTIAQAQTLGVSVTSHGEVSNMLDLIIDLGRAAILAIVVIYFILSAQFRSYKQPIIILTSIPLSFIGCGFGLWVFRMDVQAMALIGLVSLFGIVVNNGILLLEVINDRLAKGHSVQSACMDALDERYRPILLSATTTCIGLVPLVLFGNAMTAPMASVLLFGLLFSTILTMVVVPTLFAMLFSKR